MAIINRTPDSFFDGGATFADGPAMDAIDRAVDEGADVVDIGGVKAGVGAAVSIGEEIDRVVPFVEKVRAAHPDLVISVDTWRSAVATAACEAGADLINDTWAGADPGLTAVAVRFGVGIVCSHTGGCCSPHQSTPGRLSGRGAVRHRRNHPGGGGDGVGRYTASRHSDRPDA